MTVPITVEGSDDNVLEQIAADTNPAVPVTHTGSTRNRIEQVATDAGVAVPGQMSDRNAIELLAAALPDPA
jgi:hypothetical protein